MGAEDRKPIDGQEFGTNPTDLDEFVSLIDTLDTPNKEQNEEDFSVMFERYKNNILFNKGNTDNTRERPVGTEKQAMRRDLLGITAGEVLEATGLTISPIRKTSAINSEIRMEVGSGRKFNQFLMRLNPEELDDRVRGSLQKVVGDLLKEALETGPTGDERVELLAYLDGIAASLGRLGIQDETIVELKTASEHALNGDLKEYALAKKARLFDDKAARWHRSTGATKDLADPWENVLNTLKIIKKNPKAQEMFKTLLTNAKNNLELSRNDFRANVARWKRVSSDFGKGFPGVYQHVERELEQLSEG